MERRDFLKLIGIATIAPSVLAAMPKKELTVATIREFVKTLPPSCQGDILFHNENLFLAIALEDIPKKRYGWVRIGQQWTYSDVK